MRDQTVEF
ncbi:hypothetical protein FAP39_07610 [Shimia litoralis]|uniref:Uncharacterized protein n=1 Tax=Shimia litoralis TaxID=420403 RepID=A0A4U7N5P0_9RHOB|nr:hypothetical protein FAP39_07610 [Shimia litoralis]